MLRYLVRAGRVRCFILCTNAAETLQNATQISSGSLSNCQSTWTVKKIVRPIHTSTWMKVVSNVFNHCYFITLMLIFACSI